MPDLKGLFPAATAFIAFVVTLLCLFAGSQKNLLDNADLLTVRRTGHTHKPLEDTADRPLRVAAVHSRGRLRHGTRFLFRPCHVILPGHAGNR